MINGEEQPVYVEQKEQPAGWKTNLARFAALGLVILVSAALLNLRSQIQSLAALGYPGIFLAAAMSSATVLIPAPGLAIVFTMGSILHPAGVALAAGTGAALGEISGYLAGLSGRAVIERIEIYRRLSPYIRRYGPIAIFALGAIPNPTFDLAGVAAGALKMPFWHFLLAVWLAQVVKMFIFAYAGSFSLNWLFPGG
jgi:membrane protein DedA with SNARE-associated domain